MNKSYLLDIILIVLILFLLIVIGYGISIYNSDKVACLSDPIGYFEEEKNLSCSCKEINPYSIKNFSFVVDIE